MVVVAGMGGWWVERCGGILTTAHVQWLRPVVAG